MRTEVAGTRLTTVIVVISLSAIGLAIAGAYQYFAGTRQDDAVVSNPFAPASTGAKTDRSLVLHETPQPVPELSFVDDEGRELSLVDFRGRAILLNVWATWCVPCRKEMPALDRLQAKLGSPDFEVVAVSIDRGGLAPVKAFYGELGLKALGIYVDASGRTAARLGTVGIPTTLLINPAGLEAGRLVGPAEWDGPALINIIQRQLGKTPREAN
ncbi:Thiol:disulfide interchange protein TlpA [Ensifer sp. M14]|uniref:Thioredoxin protein n=1 Tax=Sinorhizobium sp. M14 TaxID=430451 RepID=A0A142BPN4_9HYPH|nr:MULTISPECIES: TlpA disulfide reductase family protein [Sinorhizobium/Ensifer group]AMP35042.1 Thioredoxin protein [Sinorhizobium sp. M14]RDL48020.1 Thiol:disulfide interchange protein TlpA [Ensifer sp. M14]